LTTRCNELGKRDLEEVREDSIVHERREEGGEGREPCSREGSVDENSLVESSKCSVMVRVRHHSTTRRKEGVESPLSFRENLRNLRRGIKEERRSREGH
jgi:hypothetical protein